MSDTTHRCTECNHAEYEHHEGVVPKMAVGMTPHTVPLADLLARVPDGVGIDVPGPEGGWAVAVIGGRAYRARVGAVERAEES